ncbi:cort [Trypoxylus dichotomus]
MNTVNPILNAPNSKRLFAADRFIPHRAGESFNIYNFTIDVFEMKDIWPPKSRVHLNYARKFFARKCYMERLRSMLELKLPNRVLNFSESNSFQDEERYECGIWPVKRRKQPLIKFPEIILDAPSLDTHLYHNMIDWSKRHDIAIIHESQIFIWHGKKEKSISVGHYKGIKPCLKFDYEGVRLAVALDKSRIGIIDVTTNKICYERSCCDRRHCRISNFAWSKSGALVSGCSNGKLSYWHLATEVSHAIYCAHKGAIVGIQFSCNENYLASSGLDNNIQIWSFPQMNYVITIVGSSPMKAFAWHPWQESIFVCSINGTSCVSIWNIRSYKEVYKTMSSSGTSFIDCMTFNIRSGELVVSFYEAVVGKSFIAVIPNLSTLSDGIIWHIGRTPYLLWNDDSTKLLTAGSDEYVCIWNFFGDEKSIPKLRDKKELSSNIFKKLMDYLEK